MDGQARDGPRKENTDVPVAVVGWTSQIDLERRILMSQLRPCDGQARWTEKKEH